MNSIDSTARTLHLVDLENLLGDPFALDGAAQVLDAYAEAAEWKSGDLTYVAANRWLVKRLAFAPHIPCQLCTAPAGPDAADLELLALARPEFLDRFDRLAIGSGDHIFSSCAQAARERGIDVIVVAPAGSIAADLCEHASVRLLDRRRSDCERRTVTDRRVA